LNRPFIVPPPLFIFLDHPIDIRGLSIEHGDRATDDVIAALRNALTELRHSGLIAAR
jgi:hypothetical protein